MVDRIPYRNLFIQYHGKFNMWLGESPSAGVVVGDEGWLFLSDTIKDYKHCNLYTQEELSYISAKLEDINNYCLEQGTKLIICIAPNKATIYGEDYLPDTIIRLDGPSRTKQLVTYIEDNTDVEILFLDSAVLEAKSTYPDYPLFLHLDTHWNYLGGYWGSRALLDKLQISLRDFDELELEQINETCLLWNGYDLVNMIGLTGIMNDDVNYHVNNFNTVQAEIFGDTTNDMTIFYTACRSNSNADDDRKVIFVRDSFGTMMMPYIATCFTEVYSPHNSHFSMEDVETEKADILIWEYVERGDIQAFIDKFETMK